MRRRILNLIACCITVGLIYFLQGHFSFHRHNLGWDVLRKASSRLGIEQLLNEQHDRYHEFINGQSRTFSQAVRTYRKRYLRHPPPGFLEWFRYAKLVHSTIIDDFDQIHHDLEPFWGMEPRVIRNRLQGLFNAGASKISIRNGTLVERVDGWNVIFDELPVLQYLPDMDIAVNTLDEPRVITPWQVREESVNRAKSTHNTKYPATQQWSPWQLDGEEEEITVVDMGGQSPHDLLHNACPPGSPMWIDKHTHSTDIQFIRNTQAFDICNLPSFEHLHGFGVSPSNFFATQTLAPVFSESKLSFFSDILVPSPRFADHTDRDTSVFVEKQGKLVWRGSTTGSRMDASWRQSHRTRIISMIKSNTSLASFLVEDTLHQLPTPQLSEVLCDVGFTSVLQCSDIICEEMRKELPAASSMSFEELSSYKYLLDVDGNTFSGRSLDFYRAHSLAIRGATFLDWQTERMFPWVHFVPLSLSYNELWSILLYFQGGDGILPGVEAHEGQAEMIAEEGSDWAEKVLRLEDMKVYWVRLLLEYGRLIRDDRDGLGYDGDGIDY